MSTRTKIVTGALAAGIVLGLPVAAMAQAEDYTREPTEVKGETFSRPTKVEGTTFARDPGDPGSGSGSPASLALTGGDVLGMAAIGLGAVGVGVVLVRRGRTQSTAS